MSRTAALRLGAFLTGAGIGSALGMVIGRSNYLWQLFGSLSDYRDTQEGFQIVFYAYFILACAMLVGGLVMMGAYFLERTVDGRKKQTTKKLNIMRPEILAIFVPIIFLLGLFAVIAMNIYFKYKSKLMMADRMSPDALSAWYSSNAQAKIQAAQAKAQVKIQTRSSCTRAVGLRVCGLLIGLGLGVTIGCTIFACGGISHETRFELEAIATFLIISLAMIFGGGGMIGTYFLEGRLDGKSK